MEGSLIPDIVSAADSFWLALQYRIVYRSCGHCLTFFYRVFSIQYKILRNGLMHHLWKNVKFPLQMRKNCWSFAVCIRWLTACILFLFGIFFVLLSVNYNTILKSQVIRPFLLRRKKDEVEKYLPGKTQVILKCDLSAWQKAYYQQVTDLGRVGLESGESGLILTFFWWHFLIILHILMYMYL